MALFDNSQFDPGSYSGGMSDWLLKALQSGLLGGALGNAQADPSQPPMQPQAGPTYAQGNQGMMGGVPFPIAGPAPMQDQSQLPPGAQPAGPAQMPQQPVLPMMQQVPGALDRLSAFAHNFGASKGIIPGLMDAIQGGVTGQRLDPAGFQRQILQAQLQSLMQQPNMTPAKALAIVQNPKLQEQYFGVTPVPAGTSLVSPAEIGKPGTEPSGNPGATSGSVYSNNSGMFSDKTLTTIADQYIAGDKSVLQNLSRSQLGAMNLMAVRNRIAERMAEKGISPETQAAKMAEFTGFQSSQKTLGQRSANIDMAVTEATQLAPQVLQTSASVDRTQYPTLNKLLLAVKEGTGDPNVVRFSAALNSFINVYSRAINPFGSTTVNDKEHARELLSTYWAKGQIAAGVQQLQKEMELAQKSPGMVRNQIRGAFTNSASGQPQQSDPLGIR